MIFGNVVTVWDFAPYPLDVTVDGVGHAEVSQIPDSRHSAVTFIVYSIK
jgi:hypothetical protein